MAVVSVCLCIGVCVCVRVNAWADRWVDTSKERVTCLLMCVSACVCLWVGEGKGVNTANVTVC